MGRVRNSDIPSLSEEDQRHLCELDFETSAVLLPPGCYLNHSCDPNAMRSGVNVYAWREIHAGEEITIDYRLNAHDGEHWACGCGAANCQGYVIGDFFSLDAERQRAYLPYAPPLHPQGIPQAHGIRSRIGEATKRLTYRMASWRVMVVSLILVSSASRNALERMIENTASPAKGR